MNAGALNKLLTIQVKTEVDTYGSTADTWADLYTDVPCAIHPVGSREFPTTLKRNAEASVRFEIRYRSGINTAQHRGQTIDDYDASPIVTRTWNFFPPYDPDGKRQQLHIEAVEVT